MGPRARRDPTEEKINGFLLINSMAEISHYLTKEFGLNSLWDSEDRGEVLQFNKELWNRWKENNGFGIYTPLEKIPGFLEFIDDYHNVQGYSLVDVGIVFGLSRQRVGQIFDRHDLERHEEFGAMNRTWGNGENRYVPIPREDYEVILRGTMEKVKKRRSKERDESKRQAHTNAIHDFQKEHGRKPSLRELSKSLGYTISKRNSGITRFARVWGYDYRDSKNTTTYTEAINNLFMAAESERAEIFLLRPAQGIDSLV